MITNLMQTATKRRSSSFNKNLEGKAVAALKVYASVTMVHDPSIPSHQNGNQSTTATRRRRRKRTSGRNVPVVLLIVSLVLLLCIWAVTLARHVYTFHNWGARRSMAAAAAFREVTATTADWRNEHDVVHIIQTRFMQNQPHLNALGLARLRLFEALTIPSMQQQSVNQFLWIIRTDPDLDEALKQQLIQAVSRVPNAVLVASNENPEGFRHTSCIADITKDTVLAGSLHTVYSYHEAAATHRVLETRCDADDALSTDFVELIQTSAATQLKQDWMVWCAENHIEWQFDSPWTNATKKGALLGLKAGKCITPGLTWGYSVKASRSGIPVSKHQQIQSKVPACDASKQGVPSKCLVKLGGELPLALRARTPTSAGMDHILIAEHTEDAFPMEHLQKSKWRHSQESLWGTLSVLFGVEAAELWRVRDHIAQNFQAIVRDALEGQCTPGHSCKDESREVLERLFNANATQLSKGA